MPLNKNQTVSASELAVGDRFYIAKDKTKTVHQIIEHPPRKTKHRIDNIWYKTHEHDKYPVALLPKTLCIYLRSTNQSQLTT